MEKLTRFQRSLAAPVGSYDVRLETVGLGRREARMDNLDWSAQSWLTDYTFIKASTAAVIKRPSASSLSQFYPMHDSLLVMDKTPPLGTGYALNDLICCGSSDHGEASKNVKRWLRSTVGKPPYTDIRPKRHCLIQSG